MTGFQLDIEELEINLTLVIGNLSFFNLYIMR